jgi:hypothetical protein
MSIFGLSIAGITLQSKLAAGTAIAAPAARRGNTSARIKEPAGRHHRAADRG